MRFRPALTHLAVAIGSVALVVASGAALGLGHRAANPRILACAKKSGGALRVSAKACHRDERRVSWNRRGPAGPAGPSNRITGHRSIPLGNTSVALFDVTNPAVGAVLAGTAQVNIVLTNGTVSYSSRMSVVYSIQHNSISTSRMDDSVVPSTLHPGVFAGFNTGIRPLVGVSFTVPSGFTPTNQYVDYTVIPDGAPPSGLVKNPARVRPLGRLVRPGTAVID